jgi:NhaA family Na+:H+ antiporter
MKQDKLSLDTIAAMIMILAGLVALVCSNTQAKEIYESFIHYKLQIGYASFATSYSLKDWIKELLMAIFFLNITLELKKEFYEGFLTDKRQFILPLFATLGGMLVPALCYLLVNYNYPQNTPGFAIPCATDIAFAMCVFNLLSRNLSSSIKIFLLSIAIFDDLGSMLIIAIF